MTDVWVIIKTITINNNTDFEIVGVYSTRQKAIDQCTSPQNCVIKFEVDKDYTYVTHFEEFWPIPEDDSDL